jgi:thymidylate kinase
MKPRSVIFFGADGTGKSTHAQLIMEHLGKEGIKARKAWIRGRHSLAFLVSQALLRLGYRYSLPFVGAPGGRILDSRKLSAKWAWSLLEFVSVVPLVIERVYIPLRLGYWVISERSVVDTAVYNSYFIGSSFDGYARVLLHMIPRNSLIVHFDAELSDVSKRRRGDIISEGFIDYQLRSYRDFARRLRAFSVDTSEEPIDKVSMRILQKIHEQPSS